MTRPNRQNQQIFDRQISIFGIIYQPLKLKTQPKVRLFRSKTMSKQFLRNSKRTLNKSRKRPFRSQNCQIAEKSYGFWINFRSRSSKIAMLVRFFFKSFPLLLARNIKKKTLKKQINFRYLKKFRGKYAQPTPNPHNQKNTHPTTQ